jgi:class 3 adenylate cyclase/alpha-beta hydrolase superfamily lysophospholipase
MGPPDELPETRFGWNGGIALAYQMFGAGAHDLLYLPGVISNVDVMWEWPPYARFLRRLGSFARVVVMDRRGYGCSERFSPDALVPLEVMVDDVIAILDAAGIDRVAVFAYEDGGTLASLLAASKPERVSHLALQDPLASWTRNDELPWEWTRERWEKHIEMFRRTWGVKSPDRMAEERLWREERGGTGDIDEREIRWAARMERATMGPGAMVAETRKFMEIDIRAVLPTIHAPTLVVARTGRTMSDPRSARYVADRIEGARYIEVAASNDDGRPWETGWEALSDEIEEFVVGTRRGPEPNRVLATALFTDIVGSSTRASELGDAAWHELLERHHHAVREELSKFGGTEQDTAGDGFFAAFDGPARAVRCAQAIMQAVRSLGLEVRIGLHTGECEVVDGKVSGIAAITGARVMAKAQASEILVSRTVKDLVAGSGLSFEDAGEHELRGVPDRWLLYRVVG